MVWPLNGPYSFWINVLVSTFVLLRFYVLCHEQDSGPVCFVNPLLVITE